MEAPPIDFLGTQMSDHERVMRFVAWVQRFIQAVVNDIDPKSEQRERHLAHDVPIDLRAEAGEAWRELNDLQVFQQVLARLRDMQPAQLQSRGLTGRQLLFKLRLVAWRVVRLANRVTDGMVRKALLAIDVPLKSVLEGVPVVGHAIVELKEALEEVLGGD